MAYTPRNYDNETSSFWWGLLFLLIFMIILIGADFVFSRKLDIGVLEIATPTKLHQEPNII